MGQGERRKVTDSEACSEQRRRTVVVAAPERPTSPRRSGMTRVPPPSRSRHSSQGWAATGAGQVRRRSAHSGDTRLESRRLRGHLPRSAGHPPDRARRSNRRRTPRSRAAGDDQTKGATCLRRRQAWDSCPIYGYFPPDSPGRGHCRHQNTISSAAVARSPATRARVSPGTASGTRQQAVVRPNISEHEVDRWMRGIIDQDGLPLSRGQRLGTQRGRRPGAAASGRVCESEG